MKLLQKGLYQARFAHSQEEVERAQAFRARCFGLSQHLDVDHIDKDCLHMLIEKSCTGQLVSCFRLMQVSGGTISASYSARFYDLAALKTFKGPMLEMGRFCIDPAHKDPDILRLGWSALAAYVDRQGVRLLFGCASFQGIDPAPYIDSFAQLKARNLAPCLWAPGVKADEVYEYASVLKAPPARGLASIQTPPLLRSYLSMGAWVSDHAVIDRALDTLHVFTGLEIDAIPPSRKKLLRAL